jgi:hypothetical protein
MSQILLDSSLQPLSSTITVGQRQRFLNTIVENNNCNRKYIQNSIPEDAAFLHRGYLDYLGKCYGQHYGVVVTPHLIWYTIIAEVANHCKQHSEVYRSFYTKDSQEKVDVVCIGNIASTGIDFVAFIAKLQRLVPGPMDIFFPTFSSTPVCATAFMDAASPYYKYSMMLCGIPRVRVEGTVEDWNVLLQHLQDVAKHFHLLENWVTQIQAHILKIRDAVLGAADISFWKNMYYTTRCGSGHQTEIQGWITDFIIQKPKLRYLENFPPHVSVVKVRQIETNELFQVCAGILYSDLKDGFIEPSFAYLLEQICEETG